MNNTSKMIVAVAAGAVVGAMLGMLFAPQKGSELRKKIAEGSKKIAEKGKKIADDFREKLETRAKDWKEKVQELV